MGISNRKLEFYFIDWLVYEFKLEHRHCDFSWRGFGKFNLEISYQINGQKSHNIKCNSFCHTISRSTCKTKTGND